VSKGGKKGALMEVSRTDPLKQISHPFQLTFHNRTLSSDAFKKKKT
jgi:hypothetical protein